MKRYELLTIIKPNMDADEADKIIAKIEETVKGFGGNVLETEKMGRKKLAHDIQNFRDGHFSIQKMELPGEKVVDLKRQLKLNENVLRIMFVDESKVKA